MASKPLRERIVDQFSYQGEHADVWKGFDLLLETEEFLNLGYSKPYRPQFLGSSQRRLATEIGAGLADRFPFRRERAVVRRRVRARGTEHPPSGGTRSGCIRRRSGPL
jgi:hypothetical protein